MATETKPLAAAVYARKSNEQDGREVDAKSVTRQVERAREFAARKGWEFSEQHAYIDDAVSGAEWNHRHAWNRLKADIGDEVAGDVTLPFDVLIVAAQSRIGRDSTRVPYENSEDTGVTIWSYLDDKKISVSTDSDEILTVFSGIADSFQRKAARSSPPTSCAVARRPARWPAARSTGTARSAHIPVPPPSAW